MVTEDARQRLVSYLGHQASKDVPALLRLIDEQRARLLAILDGVSEEQAAFRPAPDQWSIADVLRHVIAAEEGVALIVESLARGVVPEGQRALGSHIPDAGQPLAALSERLRAARRDLLERVQAWPASPDLAATFEHPFFGPLNCKGWLAFQRLHDADHIGQIEQIMAAEGYPGAAT
jgi:uncharacterized damage-inducible protein DinB